MTASNHEIAEIAAEAAAKSIEGVASGFSRTDPTQTISMAEVARMLYEAAARMRDEKDELVALIEEEL